MSHPIIMDSLLSFFFSTAILLLSTAVREIRGDAMVTGTVFCDQCKDGQRSFFDYPLDGAKVMVACGGNDGQMTMWKEETTNMLGSYTMRFEGSPDLRGCYAQVSGTTSNAGCGASAGPPENLKLMFEMFDMALYTVDALISQPAQPMPFCPTRSSNPTPNPNPNPNPTPTPTPTLPLPSPPSVKLPPLRPAPFLEASACPSQNWLMPEYKCYWKVVSPDTKVAVAFGLTAAGRYGTDMTLHEGLQGRGDLYRTLLREGTTALLNSYNSIQFPYPTLGVITDMNLALMGSSRQALLTALRFKRANSGKVGCKFTPCN
ncbi:protodermal factor 1 isoform X2 [Telopea speciosissima]|uniref:protodermal factor 1 isoform X2 n=1 Tax=Telopea speciosissima TaxID=54955 RepID=UPI001CC5BA3A|nr:protodermal factor 1 isoform X2 [Telopea speciosissima]